MNEKETTEEIVAEICQDFSSDTELTDLAYRCFAEIKHRKEAVAGNLLELGRLFKEVRDQELYTYLNYSSFTEFLGDPEISFSYSTVYSFIHLHELYILQLQIKPKLLQQIGHAKLQIINPVVEKDPEDWLFKAKELSKKDLINEVRQLQNLPPMPPSKIKGKELDPKEFEDYISFVKEHPCIIHPDKDSEPHHFPKTKGAGGQDTHVIPLCRECHSIYHVNAKEFLWDNRHSIFDYFYNTFMFAFKVLTDLNQGKNNA